jgi:NAD(P)-dependent dehydrogenase (short-subunit alcohol dehydrogenase family)
VRVNAVCPGAVDTPLLGNFELPEDADFDLLMRSMSPTGQLIEPAEFAAAVAYLASSDAASVNGATLVIDGGASA